MCQPTLRGGVRAWAISIGSGRTEGNRKMRTRAHNRAGIVSILALMFLVIFATLAIAFMSGVNMSVAQADNQKYAQDALLAAESGMSFHGYVLKNTTVSTGLQGTALMDALNTSLSNQAMLTGNLGSGQTTYANSVITVPAINLDATRTFDATFRLSGTNISLAVTGHSGPISRTVTMNFPLTQAPAMVPPCGIVTRGKVVLTGNDSVKGANNTTEGSIYTTTSNTLGVSMTGNSKIGGDLYLTNPSGSVSMTGNVSIGGATGNGAVSHIHIGAPPVDIPEVDPTPFIPLATNTVDNTTNTSGNKTFKNIRIKAGTNPTFSGNITIQGVVYIEKPNRVSFTGNLNMTGVIVTDPGHNNASTNQINFSGNTTSSGVENLPNTPDFATLRTMTGAFLLAPGFTTKFTGNFGTVNGVMAAEAFTFTGNAGGLIKGSIINYSSADFTMTGNSTLTFDHSTYTGTIPGLVSSPKFTADPTSYTENSH